MNYSSSYYGLERDAALPDCRVQQIVETPIVSWSAQPQLSIGLGQLDDPAAYLRGWAARLVTLADQVEARQPVPFVPAEATS